VKDSIHRIPASIKFFQEGDLNGIGLKKLGQYLKEKTRIPIYFHGNIYDGLPKKRVEEVAKALARIKVKDPGKRFTPLEGPAIYGRDVERKCSFIVEDGVKAPSFLTGFTLGMPLQAEIDYEERRIRSPEWKVFGILYEGVWYQEIISDLIFRGQQDSDHCFILLTNQLFGTWDREDQRYHARASLYGFPHLISISGVVEAPAKPKEFYLKKQMGLPLELLKKEYEGRFLDHGDLRMTEVLKGYVMQALFFYLMGNPFCEDRDCRLFNSHWQEDVLHSQMDGPYEFCPKHEAILKELRDRSK